MDPLEYQPDKHRPNLEELLEKIASGSAQIADLDSTRHSRYIPIQSSNVYIGLLWRYMRKIR